MQTGKLVRWNDQKGFGFIKPIQGGRDIFIHITALKGMPRKPIIGDTIIYQVHTDNDGKQRAVNSTRQGLETSKTNKVNISRKSKPKSKISKLIFTVLIVVFIGSYIFSFLSKDSSFNNANEYNNSNQYSEIDTYEPQFSCDGKEFCSEMNSCAEAMFYIQNCPNTKMDGNRDGVPCESQWCN